MGRGEDAGPGGGPPFQVPGENPVGLPGVVQVPVLGLLREDMGLQPVQQLQVHAQPPEGVLRCVDVEVGEAGDDEPAAPVLHRQAPVGLGQDLIDTGGHAVHRDQEAVPHGLQVPGVPAVAEVPFQYEGIAVHSLPPLNPAGSDKWAQKSRRPKRISIPAVYRELIAQLLRQLVETPDQSRAYISSCIQF